MKKLIIFTAITMWATIALHAQTEYSAQYYHKFNTNYGYIQFTTAQSFPPPFNLILSLPDVYIDTDKNGFRFNKPIKTPAIESLGSNLDFKVSNATKLSIRNADGYMYIPYNINLTFGTEINEGINRM